MAEDGLSGGRARTLDQRVDGVRWRKQTQGVQGESQSPQQQHFLKERSWVPYPYGLASPLFFSLLPAEALTDVSQGAQGLAQL